MGNIGAPLVQVFAYFLPFSRDHAEYYAALPFGSCFRFIRSALMAVFS